MNKGEFINAISEKANVNVKETKNVFEAMTEVICETLANGEKIAIAGYGNYEVVQRAARKGRNPHTGEEINIAAKKAPVFRPSKVMKDAVNN